MKPHANYVTVSDDTLRVELSDGRNISVPLAWYPRLVHATQDERKQLGANRERSGNPLAPLGRRPQCRGIHRRPAVGGESTVPQTLA